MSQVANLPRYSTFLEFFGKGTQGGPCECSRPLAERSLRYPSYTNFRDRRPGAGLLIQTNRIGTTAVHLPRGGAAEGRAARRWRTPFRSTSLCAEEPAANDAAATLEDEITRWEAEVEKLTAARLSISVASGHKDGAGKQRARVRARRQRAWQLRRRMAAHVLGEDDVDEKICEDN